jgi:hypothetical protein
MHPLGAQTWVLTVCSYHLHLISIQIQHFWFSRQLCHFRILHSTSGQCRQTCLLHVAHHQHGGPITWCLPAAFQGLIPRLHFLTLSFLTRSQLPCGFLLICADQAASLLPSVQQQRKRSTTSRQRSAIGQSGLTQQPAAFAAGCSGLQLGQRRATGASSLDRPQGLAR